MAKMLMKHQVYKSIDLGNFILTIILICAVDSE